jgi:hypothetical protein
MKVSCFELRNVYTGTEYISVMFWSESQLNMNIPFVRQHSVTVSARTEWNVGAALVQDLYDVVSYAEGTIQ